MTDTERHLATFCALNKIYGYRTRKIIETICRSGIESVPLDEQSGDLFGCDEGQGLEWGYEEMERCRKEGISLIPYTDSRYPSLLKECCDAPIMLYARGNMPDKGMISVVGTRRPDAYGLAACRSIVKELHNIESPPAIVSGLAFGIDREAHATTLDANGCTVAVMATGADMVYPAVHRRLAEEIVAKGGCLISDFPLGTQPIAINFLRRNRIIAGISSATAVIQSPKKGGSMVTATEAFSYGRNIFAVPGRLGDRLSEGCNYLIASQMAECILSAAHFSSLFGRRKALQEMTYPEGDKGKILKVISESTDKCDTDYILSRHNIGIRELILLLTELETDGTICRPDGMNWRININFSETK